MIEYAVWMAVCVLAMAGAQVFLKRSVSGSLKANTDAIGPQYSYSASNLDYDEAYYSNRSEAIAEGGEYTSTLLNHEVSATAGYYDDFSNRPLTGNNAERLFE